MKNRILYSILCLLLCISAASAQLDPPESFKVSANVEEIDAATSRLIITFEIKKGAYLYANKVAVSSITHKLTHSEAPKPKTKFDQFENAEMLVYDRDFTFTSIWKNKAAGNLAVLVKYQGCNESLCFLPEQKVFTFAPAGMSNDSASATGATSDKAYDWEILVKDFDIVARDDSYMPVERFLGFLDRAEGSGGKSLQDRLKAMLQSRGVLFALMFALIGGISLNLTPCVLPMIPINIAIIGAGAQAGSKMRGFALGTVYGIGMSLAYGLLGVAVVHSSKAFGSLQSMPAFNFTIAALFVFLALAMFGVFNIDFTKHSGKLSKNLPEGGKFLTALLMGAISAILAGACVAPVVIAVLTYSSGIYAEGHQVGLVLPFFLGIGMALPWPFAGAGLSLLPKPGKWMDHVKHAFGIFILLFSLYYGWEGAKLVRPEPVNSTSVAEGGWMTSLPEALAVAKEQDKLVLIDFWASWCKACLTMDRLTFSDEQVEERMEKYVRVKHALEDPNSPANQKIMKHFEFIGLPSYFILKPKEQE